MFSYPVIAALRQRSDIPRACSSAVTTVFMMCGSLMTVSEDARAIRDSGKDLFIHIDLIKGLGSDREGVEYLSRVVKPTGIVTTRTHLIKCAREFGMRAVQHLFIIDTQAYDTGMKNISDAKPDAVEIMPGLMPRIVREFANRTRLPILAAGLIRSREEIRDLLDAGCAAIITGAAELWNMSGLRGEGHPRYALVHSGKSA